MSWRSRQGWITLPLAAAFGGLALGGCDPNAGVPEAHATPKAHAIYVNSVGFAPDARKIAIVHSDRKEPQDWALYDEDDQIVTTGKTVPLGHAPRAERALHRIDFSDVTTPGRGYSLRVGETGSDDFDIADSLYSGLVIDAGRYFYHNRAGMPITEQYAGVDYARPAGHPNEVVTCFSGTDLWGMDWPGCDYQLNVTGGWYDAGDHGKYVVNAGISTWTLLDAAEQFPEICADGCFNIPESGNGISDVLDEARYNIEWMLSMQIPDGNSVWVAKGQQEAGQPLTLTKIEEAGGLVHHKVHDESWAGNIPPHENDKTRYLYPPSTAATLNLAAVAARCARIWVEIDPDFAERCRGASIRASESLNRIERRALSNTDKDAPFEVQREISRNRAFTRAFNNFDGGGPYGDKKIEDEEGWASSERNWYREHFRRRTVSARPDSPIIPIEVPSFNETSALDLLSEIGVHKQLGSGTIKPDSLPVKSLIKFANTLLAETDAEPFHIPYASDSYQWGSNGHLANRGMVLGHAYLLTGERKYRDGVVDIMDYFLGRNPMGVSYITGYGARPFETPHHRHWAHSVRDGAPKPPPGVLSGGPNNDNMSDPIAKEMVGTCAAQTCWTDHYEAWTQNEVTINWNAPLFWMAAFLDATEDSSD